MSAIDRDTDGWMSAPPRELAAVAGIVRREAITLDAVAVAVTWRTSTGEMQVDYRAGDWLRIEFSGDGRERRYLLDPDWGEAC